KYVWTCGLIASTRLSMVPASRSCAARAAATSATRPSDIETTSESITCTLLGSVMSAAWRADAYVPLSFSEMWIETTASWFSSSAEYVSAKRPGEGCDVVGWVDADGSLR